MQMLRFWQKKLLEIWIDLNVLELFKDGWSSHLGYLALTSVVCETALVMPHLLYAFLYFQELIYRWGHAILVFMTVALFSSLHAKMDAEAVTQMSKVVSGWSAQVCWSHNLSGQQLSSARCCHLLDDNILQFRVSCKISLQHCCDGEQTTLQACLSKCSVWTGLQ